MSTTKNSLSITSWPLKIDTHNIVINYRKHYIDKHNNLIFDFSIDNKSSDKISFSVIKINDITPDINNCILDIDKNQWYSRGIAISFNDKQIIDDIRQLDTLKVTVELKIKKPLDSRGAVDNMGLPTTLYGVTEEVQVNVAIKNK